MEKIYEKPVLELIRFTAMSNIATDSSDGPNTDDDEMPISPIK